MRLLQVCLLVLVLGSCDEIDGLLQIFTDFSLVDEDGHRWQLPAQRYEADFSYDRGKREVELEIDEIDDGDDVDFIFYVPHMDQIDFNSNHIELNVGEHASGQGVGLESTITRNYDAFGPYTHEYTNSHCRYDSVYYHPFVVYDVVETRVNVDGRLYRHESHLADFEAAACGRRTEVRYCVDCYGNIHHRCIYNHSLFC
ncbi:MAG: hypothetical protein OYH77_03390 [Pseudomonadota bacterium]|nr:hypothetical protein [Pseudomonadota bacterium]